MPGPSVERSASFTRPSDTTQYAIADLVANSTTAGSVNQLSWTFNTGQGLWLREVRVYKTQVSATSADFRLWLHSDSAVTFTNGDNGALSIASSTLAVTDVAIALDIPAATFAQLTGSGSVAVATFDAGLVALTNTTYGFLESRSTYTPASAEVFTIVVRGDPY